MINRFIFSFFTAWLFTSLAVPFDSYAKDVVYLQQNWTEHNQFRSLSYHASQGSQIIPYSWFLHLELESGETLINNPINIERLGYLPDYQPNLITNPDQLPIGFVKDSDPNTGDWIGINCAACHTGEIKVDNTLIRIDGAPSTGDYIGLLTTIRNALRATISLPSKFERFATALNIQDDAQRLLLKNDMQASTLNISGIIKRNSSPKHLGGFGRVDAFTSIRNEVFEHDLGIALNHRTADAPVSYPFIWDTPHLDYVQWAGNVSSSYGRNVGQVLGVLGRVELQNPDQLFQSSIQRENLFRLESWLAELKSPAWPENYLGTIDQESATRGEEIYRRSDHTGYACVDCHSLPNDAGQYPLTSASQNKYGKQFIQTQNISLLKVGTDPNTVNNIYDIKPIFTGDLSDELDTPLGFGIGALLLRKITRSVVDTLFDQAPSLNEEQRALYTNYRTLADGIEPEDRPIGYKARPLNGIWATAPFLHNGSVPNLYELLLPPIKRSNVFYLGDHTFDAKKVGYISTPCDNCFRFDTRQSGNRNSGHRYGIKLSEQERLDLVEFLKTL